MKASNPSNADMARLLEPWFPLFTCVGTAAERDHFAAIPILGIPRRIERASDLHRTWRENLRRACELASPILSLAEEPDGQGLDYLVCRMDESMPFVLRWGRFNGATIRRNRTGRNKEVQEQGHFWTATDEEHDGMPTVSVGYTIEDDYTEAGQPQWWIGRLLLLRERADESEVITEMHVYSAPTREGDDGRHVPPPLVVAREDEELQWEQMIQNIRGQSA